MSNFAERLGRAFRREASLTSVRNVRRLDEQRLERIGDPMELNTSHAAWVRQTEARVARLEAEVLGVQVKSDLA